MSNMMITPSISTKIPVRPSPQPQFQGGGHPTVDPKTKALQKAAYQSPRPKPLVMELMTALNKYWIFSGMPVLRSIPWVNKIPTVKGFQLKSVDIPESDLQLLKEATNPKNIAIVAPNHPEFFTDMLPDKWLSSKVAPSMAWWAGERIVNGSSIKKHFMLANNIIANNGKEQAWQDSLKTALQGKGVLLHPEGHTMWHGDKVHDLFPGTMRMAVEAAQNPDSKDKPVNIIPVVWKYEFNSDVSKGLHKDMAFLETKLELPSSPNLSVGERFFKLHESLLSHQQDALGFTNFLKAHQKLKAHQELPYFQRQREFQEFLIHNLEQNYGIQPGPSIEKKMRNLEKAVSKAKRENMFQVSKKDRAMLTELYRLVGFSPELYNRPFLTQEHLHENIKRSMQSFFEGSMETTFPIPAGTRTLHIRVANPIRVREQLRPNMSNEERQQVVEQLRTQVHEALQGKLNKINQEIAPSVARFQVENAFYMPQQTS